MSVIMTVASFDLDDPIFDGDGDIIAAEQGGGGGQVDDIHGQDLPIHDMIEQDVGQGGGCPRGGPGWCQRRRRHR